MYRTINHQSFYQQRNPLEKKRRDLAQQIAVTFPEINIDISATVFQQPKVNQLLDQMLKIFDQSGVFTLPENYASTKQDIFRAISMLMANYMEFLPPMQALPMSILIKIDFKVESNFNPIHTLFTYMCKLKSLHDKFTVREKSSLFSIYYNRFSFLKDKVVGFNNLHYTDIQHLKDVASRQPMLKAKVEKLIEKKAQYKPKLTVLKAKVEKIEDSLKVKTKEASQLNECNLKLTRMFLQEWQHSSIICQVFIASFFYLFLYYFIAFHVYILILYSNCIWNRFLYSHTF